jgi:hypothetical protein
MEKLIMTKIVPVMMVLILVASVFFVIGLAYVGQWLGVITWIAIGANAYIQIRIRNDIVTLYDDE